MKPYPRKPSTFFPDDDRNARPLYESVAPINGAEQMNRRRNPFTNQKQPRWRRSLPPILSAYSRSTQLLKETACAALIVSCRVGESLVRQLSRGRASLVSRRTFQRPSIATALGCTLLALAGFRFLMPRSAADQPRADSLESTVATHHWRPRGDVRLPDPNVAATSGRGSPRGVAATERDDGVGQTERLAGPANFNAVPNVAPSAKERVHRPPEVGARRRRATNWPVGKLRVSSRPAGASVSINGVPRGETPLTVNDVRAGTRVVRLELAGYQPWSWAVNVEADRSTPLTITLQPEGSKK
jgi:hypothetical protein